MRFYLRCISYFRKDLPQIGLSLVLIFLATLAGLLQPFPLAILIDTVINENKKPAGGWQYRLIGLLMPHGDRPVAQIVYLAGATLLLAAVGAMLTMAQKIAGAHVGYQGLRFFVVSLLALAANELLLTAFVAAGMGKIVAQAIAIVLVTPINFVGNKLWSFRPR